MGEHCARVYGGGGDSMMRTLQPKASGASRSLLLLTSTTVSQLRSWGLNVGSNGRVNAAAAAAAAAVPARRGGVEAGDANGF